ncbi:putative E3 ubiquitin-protein ligase RING1a isoform X2 [Rutidosis leptorrhynchoides]|uniref:putative E3 ubiquitin-protein ligase RING1a isoform X2 n=1 Tax=Rutidosis leptorrhynchoides TaxID=125765 RepID=UPI003A99A5DD
MPDVNGSNDSVYQDEQQPQQNVPEASLNDDVQSQEQAESDADDDDDDESTSSYSSSDSEEFVYVKLADVRNSVQCPICLGILRKTRKVLECLHRFCRECIDKSMRLGNNECPACRAHCASRRSLRDDPNFDNLIALLYPDIDKYEEEELTFSEDEKARNEQASIAQTSRRQLEALGKKRASAKATAAAYIRRSQTNNRNLRGKRNRKSTEPLGSDNEVNAGRSSTSEDEHVLPKRYKRRVGCQSANGGCDNNEAEGSRKPIGVHVSTGGSPEILTWGCGGIRSGSRSHTRHGSQSSSGVKNTSSSQLPKLIDHLQKLPQNDDDKLNFNLKLLSLDEQNIPNLQQPYICCKSTMSTFNIREYVAHMNDLEANKIELLLVKGDRNEVDNSVSSSLQPEPVVNPQTVDLQLLEDHQILLDIAKTSCRNHLTMVYRERPVSKSTSFNEKDYYIRAYVDGMISVMQKKIIAIDINDAVP